MGGTIVLTLIEALLILLALLISKAIRFISPSLYGDQLVTVDDSSKDDVILTQTAPTTKYDVFLSFRGEDTRHTFASYLYKGLCNAGIHTFMDYKLRKGEHISKFLLRTIEESEISMIIFSKNYASSTWCLDELVHILECKEKFGRVVIPVFYNIDPSNIHKQSESFGDGFNKVKRRFRDNPEKSKKWINALVKAANLSGWNSNIISPEFKLVEEIVKDALSKLNYSSSYHHEGLIGITRHIKNIENLLTKAHIVGIWGMGGAGKTTLADAIFRELKAQFDGFSFIENVKEQLKKIGLNKLLQNCLQELLEDKEIRVYDIKSPFVKKRLGRKKILLILDDVDDPRIAKDLTKLIHWFGKDSKIIITSRDMQVLKNADAFSTYHVPELDFYNSLHLFSLIAFSQHKPYEGYMDLSISIVTYCQGNPLALKVLGCHLYYRKKIEWESVLKKLEKDPFEDVVDVLKLSFDGLGEEQQKAFLDLVFLINERVDISSNLISQLYGSSGLFEISVLREKSLISSNNHCLIVMHNLVKEMGHKIARNQLTSVAKTPVRLWQHEDIADFFNRGKGIEAIRCLSLDVSKMKSITLRANIFRKIQNLIYLKIYKSDWRKPSMLKIRGVLDYLSEELRFLSWEECPLPYVPLHFCAENLIKLEMRNSNIQQLWKGSQSDRRRPPMLNICGDLNYLPKELRFLSWEECPLSFVPLHICANNLIALDMPNSNIQQLWNGNQHFPNLERIDLSYSKHLTALPDLSHAPNIENLNLEGCVNLAQIHSSTYLGKGGEDGKIIKVNIQDCGPMQIKFGGSMKGRSSGSVIVSSVFDLEKLSWYKITTKVFACGNMRYGVRLKYEVMPLEEQKKLRKVAQSLGSLLPFVSEVNWVEGPIEFGHDFNQHHDYNHYRQPTLKNWRHDDKEDDVLMNEHSQVVTMSLMEDDEEDDVLIEDCCSKSVTFTRVPNSITRWSLLTQLTLKSQSLPLSNVDYCRRMKLHLDVTYSYPGIIPSSNSPWTLQIDYTIKQLWLEPFLEKWSLSM